MLSDFQLKKMAKNEPFSGAEAPQNVGGLRLRSIEELSARRAWYGRFSREPNSQKSADATGSDDFSTYSFSSPFSRPTR
jgi:hypothetical protein